jgi:hypothetical protein
MKKLWNPKTVDALPLNVFNPLSGKCGKPIKQLVGKLYFSCVLPRGHSGDCQPGGVCPFHKRPYIGKQCPEWPDCVEVSFNR